MSESILVKHQKQTFSKPIEDGKTITVTLRYDDDECGNGHNSFSITGAIMNPKIRGSDKIEVCGCIHYEIAKYFPEFEHLIKWHLMDSTGPMHYVANSMYWAQEGYFDRASRSAIWPEAGNDDFTKEKLEARLPALIAEFRTVIEQLGFIF